MAYMTGILTGLVCFVLATTIADARPRPKPADCARRVCVKYARGAPGTFAGRCLKYQTKYYYRCPRPNIH